MNATQPGDEPSAVVTYDATQEVRIAGVMYGGLSLAIYMNGIAQEMLRLVRATAPDPNSPAKARFGGKQLESTEVIYRKLAQILYHGRSPGELTNTHPEPDDPIRTRIVIDILSGTSAGGINAVYLAKALVNCQSLGKLHDLWLSEADMDTLLNDDGSDQGKYPSNPRKTSLLNSQRMYGILLEAFEGMEDTNPGRHHHGFEWASQAYSTC
jgi:patatin-related protein